MPRRLRRLAVVPLLLAIVSLLLVAACDDDETINVFLPDDDDADSLRIAQSNLPASTSGGTVLGGTIYLVFSAAMDTTFGGTSVSLRTERSPGTAVPIAPVWISSMRLEIVPQAGRLNDSTEYAFSISAASLSDEPFMGAWRNLRFDLNPTPVGGDCAETVISLAQSLTSEAVNYDTKTVGLIWSAVSCASGYRVFAKDSFRNQEWIFIAEDRTDFESGAITRVVTLPAQFDRYASDNVQSPFAGTVVTFAVVPMNAVSGDPDAGHVTLDVRDEIAPAILSSKQVGAGTNDGDGSVLLEFSVRFDEFIGFGTTGPRFEITEAGGDPAFTLNPSAGQWIWDTGRRSGRFRFLMAPGDDASGDLYRIVFDSLEDLSGNVAAGAPATAEAEIVSGAGAIVVANHDFETGGLSDNRFSSPGVIPSGWRNFGGLGGSFYGFYNPDNNGNLSYPGTTPDAPGVIGTMEGPNVFYFGTFSNGQGIEQDLSVADAVEGVFDVRRDYAVTVALGERLVLPDDRSMADLTIVLLAGSTVLRSQTFDAATIPAGTFGDVTLSVAAESIANAELLVGEPLIVRLLETPDSDGGPELDIDNVRVSFTFRSARNEWSAAFAE